MPNRWGRSERRRIYKHLAALDGEHRTKCAKTPDELTHTLEIDHVDENKFNDALENLQFLCKPCNAGKQNRSRARHRTASPGGKSKDTETPEFPSAKKRREERTSAHGLQLQRRLEDNSDLTPLQASRVNRPKFQSWLEQQLSVTEMLPWLEIVDAAAYEVSCSQASATNYLKAMTSFVGPLERFQSDDGVLMVRFRSVAASSK